MIFILYNFFKINCLNIIEFFYVYISINIILFILYILLIFVTLRVEDHHNIILIMTILFFLVTLVSSIPILSSMVRRLHDTGRLGWHTLSFIIPVWFLYVPLISSLAFLGYIYGQIYIIFLCCTDLQQMSNEFGPSSKYIMSSRNLIPGNNYIPPNGPINIYPQANSINSNYPYPQPNPFQNQGNPFPQENPIQNQGNPFPQQNPIQNQQLTNLS